MIHLHLHVMFSVRDSGDSLVTKSCELNDASLVSINEMSFYKEK